MSSARSASMTRRGQHYIIVLSAGLSSRRLSMECVLFAARRCPGRVEGALFVRGAVHLGMTARCTSTVALEMEGRLCHWRSRGHDGTEDQ